MATCGGGTCRPGRRRLRAIGFEDSHTNRKDKNAASVGHPKQMQVL
jgi:hypothetical protein